jgi:hypothetical protein
MSFVEMVNLYSAFSWSNLQLYLVGFFLYKLSYRSDAVKMSVQEFINNTSSKIKYFFIK